jgi:hypothetical protein
MNKGGNEINKPSTRRACLILAILYDESIRASKVIHHPAVTGIGIFLK